MKVEQYFQNFPAFGLDSDFPAPGPVGCYG